MKRKFGTTLTMTTLAVALSACSPANTQELSQSELRQYCGVDLQKLEKDMKAEDPRIQSISLRNTDCDVVAEYKTSDGTTRTEGIGNDMLMAMVAGGGAAMLTSYLMGNSSQRSSLQQESERRRAGGGSAAFIPMYTSGNNGSSSRAYNAYRSGNKASAINVSGGKVTTRSNAFSGTSARSTSSTSGARASGYSGGG